MVVVMVTVVTKHPVVNQLMVRIQSVKHPEQIFGSENKKELIFGSENKKEQIFGSENKNEHKN